MKPLVPPETWIQEFSQPAIDRDIARARWDSCVNAYTVHLPMLDPWSPVPAIEQARLLGECAHALHLLCDAIKESARSLEIQSVYVWPPKALFWTIKTNARKTMDLLRDMQIERCPAEGYAVAQHRLQEIANHLNHLHAKVHQLDEQIYRREQKERDWLKRQRIGGIG